MPLNYFDSIATNLQNFYANNTSMQNFSLYV